MTSQQKPISYLTRKAYGLTQRDFSDLIGVNHITQNRRENGHCELSDESTHLYKLMFDAKERGLEAIVVRALDYPQKSEGKSLMRIASQLSESGYGALLRGVLHTATQEPLNLMTLIPILQRAVKVAQSHQCKYVNAAGDNLDQALMQLLRARLEESNSQNSSEDD